MEKTQNLLGFKKYLWLFVLIALASLFLIKRPTQFVIASLIALSVMVGMFATMPNNEKEAGKHVVKYGNKAIGIIMIILSVLFFFGLSTALIDGSGLPMAWWILLIVSIALLIFGIILVRKKV